MAELSNWVVIDSDGAATPLPVEAAKAPNPSDPENWAMSWAYGTTGPPVFVLVTVMPVRAALKIAVTDWSHVSLAVLVVAVCSVQVSAGVDVVVRLGALGWWPNRQTR
jgi:hypothetical protein